MKKVIIMVLLGVLVLLTYRCFYFSSNSLEGLYINNNTSPILEGPSAKVDTLKIYNDYTFENQSWGKGTYEITGNRITFKYEYDYGKANFSTSIYRPALRNSIRITLNSDLAFYYEKVK
ncbi:hypothetical protein [uncultured Psychroserpens sp.]|uniref:hypothetical protein n=1 Tax=uncultured Psychroserpens sp. TaxID=255436 RepID=UPI0026241984|nr:hypothetical protein [uncultured Psychroserpens sp.]